MFIIKLGLPWFWYTPIKIFRKTIKQEGVLILFHWHTHSSVGKSIVNYDTAVVLSRCFWRPRPFWVREVHVMEAKALTVALRPFKVVQQWPRSVAFYVYMVVVNSWKITITQSILVWNQCTHKMAIITGVSTGLFITIIIINSLIETQYCFFYHNHLWNFKENLSSRLGGAIQIVIVRVRKDGKISNPVFFMQTYNLINFMAWLSAFHIPKNSETITTFQQFI